MDNYIIRFATKEDIPDIMGFIKQYWKAGHVLGTNRNFFEYEHKIDEINVNFALAFDNHSNDLLCICGFLQSSKDIWRGCVWEVVWMKKPGAPRGIGVDVMNYIPNHSGASCDILVGVNPATIPIHIERGYFVDKMCHYYRLNANKKCYNIANITNRHISSYDTSTPIKLLSITKGDLLEKIMVKTEQQQPYKDYWYIKRRYINHPIYRYNIWVLQHTSGSANSILITRTVQTEIGSVLRIVDYVGLHYEMSFIGAEIDRLMCEYDCEYTDIYCYGVNDEFLFRMGFTQKANDDINIIPNYFEPFIQENIDIVIASSVKDGFNVFKGDADQDRPSII